MRKILFLMLGFTALFGDKEVKIYVEKIHCPLCTAIVLAAEQNRNRRGKR